MCYFPSWRCFPFVEIHTPSLAAQGEQRRLSLFNIRRGNSGRPDRTKFKSETEPTTEERAAAQQGFAANFGTWSISEADQTLTQHWEGALVPNNEGIEIKTTVSGGGIEQRLDSLQENDTTSAKPRTPTKVDWPDLGKGGQPLNDRIRSVAGTIIDGQRAFAFGISGSVF
jgi:hypothetical protein